MCRGISQSRKGVAGVCLGTAMLSLQKIAALFLLFAVQRQLPGGEKSFLSLSHIRLYVLTFESCCQFSFLNYSMDFLSSSNQQLCYLKYDSNGNIFRKSVMPQVKSSLFHNQICSALLLMSGTEIKKLCYAEQKIYTDTPRVCIKLSS